MSTREKKRRKANDGSPVALPVSSRAAVSPIGDDDDKTHLYTPTIAVIHECMPGVFANILSFLNTPDWVAVSETSKDMCSTVRNNDNLWQRFLPRFPHYSPDPSVVPVDEDLIDPRYRNGFENLTVFFQAKKLLEYEKYIFSVLVKMADEYEELRRKEREARLMRAEAILLREARLLRRRRLRRRHRPVP